MKKDSILKCCPFKFGAGEESRTLDLNLGKVALYQLSYSRNNKQDYSVVFLVPLVGDKKTFSKPSL